MNLCANAVRPSNILPGYNHVFSIFSMSKSVKDVKTDLGLGVTIELQFGIEDTDLASEVRNLLGGLSHGNFNIARLVKCIPKGVWMLVKYKS